MAEIHEIREKHYYETLEMSREENREYFNKKVEHLEKEYGLNLPTR